MKDRKPTLCVVAGPNGSGKTSTTVQLLNSEWTEESVYINPDNIAQEMFGDWNSPNSILKAAEYATKKRYECLRNGVDFVFETFFLCMYIRSSHKRISYNTTLHQWWT